MVAVEIVLELAFALPANNGPVASALTVFAKHHARETGQTYLTYYEKPFHQEVCPDGRGWRDVGAPVENENSELAALTPLNFALPLMVLVICCFVAFLRTLCSGTTDY